MNHVLLKLMLTDINSFLGSFTATEGVPIMMSHVSQLFPSIHESTYFSKEVGMNMREDAPVGSRRRTASIARAHLGSDGREGPAGETEGAAGGRQRARDLTQHCSS